MKTRGLKLMAAAFTFCVFGYTSVIAQNEEKREIRKEVNVEIENGEHILTISTTENGKTTKEEYRGKEAEAKIKEMQESEGHHGDGEHEVIIRKRISIDSDSDESEDKNKVIIMEIDDEDTDGAHRHHLSNEHMDDMNMKIDEENGTMTIEINGEKKVIELDNDHDGNHSMKKMMFISEDGKQKELTEEEMKEWHAEHGLPEGMNMDINVKVDEENGQIKIVKNGEETVIDMDSEHMKEGKMMFITEDGKTFDLKDGEKGKHERVEIIVIQKFVTVEDDATLEQDLDVENFQVFPNPNDGKFSIMFDLDSKRKTVIQATDLNGRVLFSDDIKKFDGHYTNEIDLRDQPKGMYFINVIQGKKKTTKKVSVQ